MTLTLEIIGISVLWMFLFGYVIVASIDFGSRLSLMPTIR